MKQERIEPRPRPEHATEALEHIESEMRLGEAELQKGNRAEGEVRLWKALAEASGQRDSASARKILEILSGRTQH